MKARPFLQGAGLAVLYITPYAADFLTASLGNGYHRLYPISGIYRAILIAILLLWAMGAIGFLLLEKAPLLWKRVLWLIPTVLLPWLLLRGLAAALVDWPRFEFLVLHIRHFLVPLVGLGFLVLLLVRPTLFDRGIRVVAMGYGISAFGLIAIVPKTAFQAVRSVPPDVASFEHSAIPGASPSAPRIVWILMDEMSYGQAFASRRSDVLLPNFDELARSSVNFSTLQPAGAFTENVIPSLFLGKPILELRKPYLSPPRYLSEEQGEWRQFNQRDTIFADARSLGWTTGIAGWFNPYCRLLPDVLDRCSWQYSEASSGDISGAIQSTNSVSANVWLMLPFARMTDAVRHVPPVSHNQPHYIDYTGVMVNSRSLLQDSRIRFAFIHLPVPHPPGIFNRKRNSFSAQGTYLDNLVLADQALGILRHDIESTPAAGKTVLIVSSDHSWRTFMWRGTMDWSPEAEGATHGSFDPRPVLMVHLPGQQTAHVIAKSVNVLITHTIVEGLLHGQIQQPDDVDRLIASRPLHSLALESAKPLDRQTGN